MDVEAALGGRVEDRLGQDQAIGDNDGDLRVESREGLLFGSLSE